MSERILKAIQFVTPGRPLWADFQLERSYVTLVWEDDDPVMRELWQDSQGGVWIRPARRCTEERRYDITTTELEALARRWGMIQGV